MTNDQTCSLCDVALERPYPAHANYVTGLDFVETEPKTVHYALMHTDETWSQLEEIAERLPNRDKQALAAEMAHPDAPDSVEVADGTVEVETEGGETETTDYIEVDFSIPVDKFERMEVGNPNIVQQNDDVALVETVEEGRDVQKTGLICPGCTDPENHDLMWGTDAE